MTKLFIQARHLEMVQDIFKKNLPQAKVLAYGSRTKGDSNYAHEGSDLDLALIVEENSTKERRKLNEIFKESNIPFFIDIIDYNNAPQSFKEEIDKESIEIYPHFNGELC